METKLKKRYVYEVGNKHCKALFVADDERDALSQFALYAKTASQDKVITPFSDLISDESIYLKSISEIYEEGTKENKMLEIIAKLKADNKHILELLLKRAEPIQVRFKKLTATAKMPTRAHATDAGLDLYVDERETGQKACYIGNDPNFGDYYYYKPYIKYRSNIAMEIPEGYVGLLFPRSSVYKKSITAKQ